MLANNDPALADIFGEFEIPVEENSTTLQDLITLWNNEEYAPEILPYNQVLIEKTRSLLAQKVF
jgi:hypothetical protein